MVVYPEVLFMDDFNRADNLTGVGNDWKQYNPTYYWFWTIQNNSLHLYDNITTIGNVHLLRDGGFSTDYKSLYMKLKRTSTIAHYRFVGYTGPMSSLGTNAFWMEIRSGTGHKVVIEGGSTGGGLQATGHTIKQDEWNEVLIHFFHGNKTLDYYYKNATGNYSTRGLNMRDKASREINAFGWFDEQASTPKMQFDIVLWDDDYIDFYQEIIPCDENITNTTKSPSIRISGCVSHRYTWAYNITQYDINNCGTYTNITYTQNHYTTCYLGEEFTEKTCPLDEEKSKIMGLFLIFLIFIAGIIINYRFFKMPLLISILGIAIIVFSLPFYTCSIMIGTMISCIGLALIVWDLLVLT